MVAGRSTVLVLAYVWSLAAVAAPAQPAPAPPAAVPAPPGPAAGAVPVVVALAAFKPINADAASVWVGEGIRRGIELQLRRGVERTKSVLVVRDLPADAQEPDPAMAAAIKLRADVIVVGSYQVAGNEVRATGRVMSVSTGREIAFVSARSPLRTIFDLQDELGYQVRRALIPEQDETGPGAGFEGSALDRSLDGEDERADGRNPRAERNPRNPAPPVPPAAPVSRENPGGWGGPGAPGGTSGGGGDYVGGGGYGGWGGWGPYVPYVPVYYPPARPPSGGGSGGGGAGGGGGSAGGGSAGGGGEDSAAPPAGTPAPRRPIYNPRNPDTRLPPPNP